MLGRRHRGTLLKHPRVPQEMSGFHLCTRSLKTWKEHKAEWRIVLNCRDWRTCTWKGISVHPTEKQDQMKELSISTKHVAIKVSQVCQNVSGHAVVPGAPLQRGCFVLWGWRRARNVFCQNSYSVKNNKFYRLNHPFFLSAYSNQHKHMTCRSTGSDLIH